MYKVKILRKFCDKKGITHPCYEVDKDGRIAFDEKHKKINVIKEISNEAAEYGAEIGVLQILGKIKGKKDE